MIREAIMKVVNKENLTFEEAEQVMDEIMGGEASQIQMSAFLTALAMKGETIDEITACAAGMRRHCIKLLQDRDVLEIVGTGGDHANSFNISTTSAIVVSAACLVYTSLSNGRKSKTIHLRRRHFPGCAFQPPGSGF